jgi:cathepsin L
MFRTLCVLAALASSAAFDLGSRREFFEKEFYEYTQKFNVKFENGAEFIKRLSVFAQNLEMIKAHNNEKSSFTMSVNKYAHLTHAEFLDEVRIGGTRIPNLRRSEPGSALHGANKAGDNPASVDWVAAGAVTPVKNQGNCGSCWSFSTTGALEGAYEIKNDNLLSFSEQQLVSCDTTDAGCNGGWMDDAFAWIQGNGGICTEDSYPYTSGTTASSGTCVTGCSVVPGTSPVSWVDVTPGSVDAMESAVAQQPVSIAIQANQPAFQFYSGGVLTGNCGQRLDHGVLNVGYGVYSDGTPYWKVKNSWGPDWGMDGYILIEKSDADKCGVLDAGSYPTL